MAAANVAAGMNRDHERLATACATSRPAMPTYIGLRVTLFAPVSTRLAAAAGFVGSTVVRCRPNCTKDAASSAAEAAATEEPAAREPLRNWTELRGCR